MVAGNFDDAVPAFRNAHDTTDRRKISCGEKTGGDTIGSHHEILNDHPGTVHFIHFKRLDLITIEYGFRFNGFQTERSVGVAEILHLLGSLILEAEILIQPLHCPDGFRLLPHSQPARRQHY